MNLPRDILKEFARFCEAGDLLIFATTSKELHELLFTVLNGTNHVEPCPEKLLFTPINSSFSRRIYAGLLAKCKMRGL